MIDESFIRGVLSFVLIEAHKPGGFNTEVASSQGAVMEGENVTAFITLISNPGGDWFTSTFTGILNSLADYIAYNLKLSEVERDKIFSCVLMALVNEMAELIK